MNTKSAMIICLENNREIYFLLEFLEQQNKPLKLWGRSLINFNMYEQIIAKKIQMDQKGARRA